jgi:hypothetical protein
VDIASSGERLPEFPDEPAFSSSFEFVHDVMIAFIQSI